jgi:glycosyltransferase involved in cell wall biosynthesis
MNYSILMTVYKNDNPDYVKKSIRSMLNQSMLTDDFVIVKDGPISEELQSVIDKETENYSGIVNQIQLDKNLGLGLALNEGLKICKNEIVARMDSDDISIENRCEIQLNEFKRDPVLDIIGSSVDEFISEESNIVSRRVVPTRHDDILKYMKKRDPFNHPTVMYRKSKVLAVGGYSDLRKNQDTDLWIRLLEYGCKTKNIEESLLLFRFEEETYKRRKNWLNTKLLIEIRYKSYKRGFNTLGEFLKVTFAQLLIYLMPTSFQKIIYKKYLRVSKDG